MAYVDGFVVPVPVENLAAYKKLARKAGRIWREHGALRYVECAGDHIPVGKRTDFNRSVKLKEGETVIFSWILYKNRRHRDAVMKKVMADPRLKMDPKTMPFDGKRLIWGGFKTFIEL